MRLECFSSWPVREEPALSPALSPSGETGSAGYTRQEAADCKASAFLGRSGAWLLRYGLLLYSCLRTGAASWSSMPKRQPERLQLLTTGRLPLCATPAVVSERFQPCLEQMFALEKVGVEGGSSTSGRYLESVGSMVQWSGTESDRQQTLQQTQTQFFLCKHIV